MSDYRLSLKARVDRPVSIEEFFKITRAEAETYLKVLTARVEPHPGEVKLKAILTEALQKPNWQTLRLKVKKS